LILRLEKIVFIIKDLILFIGFPNNKYHSNIKNYLRCLLYAGVSTKGNGLHQLALRNPCFVPVGQMPKAVKFQHVFNMLLEVSPAPLIPPKQRRHVSLSQTIQKKLTFWMWFPFIMYIHR
jgi:hypothetical protein